MSKDPVTAITVTDTGRHTCYVDVAVLPWHLQCGDFIERISELDQPQAVEIAVKGARRRNLPIATPQGLIPPAVPKA